MRIRVLMRDGILIGLLTVASLVAVETFCQASWRQEKYIHVIVDRGMSFSQIAQRFHESGLIRNDLVFKVIGRAFRIERRAKAGRYRFEPSVSMVDILKALYRGETYREQILIPPGRRVEQIAELLKRLAEVDSTKFVALARDSTFVRSLGVPSDMADGYLLPETYDIEWREDAPSVLERMVTRFFKVFDDSLRARTASLGMDVTEALTLASIIEKEAYLQTEMPRISAVFHNRLKLGMKLQADPTVRYALGKWRGRVLYSDLKVDSPYNTYFVAGLPPHPICNPGRAAIMAALYPEPGSHELFFVARGDGGHYFSHDVLDHDRARIRYKAYLDSVATSSALDSLVEAGRLDSSAAESLKTRMHLEDVKSLIRKGAQDAAGEPK
jgi:UPF0755 protein